ncbi:MAG: Blue-light-activated protein [Lentisphaerae bacterium ADurb.BinA184]|nr:MAG: Blue-light-activated protein [Lentisphaerae bacterium ADurb.BinA184]
MVMSRASRQRLRFRTAFGVAAAAALLALAAWWWRKGAAAFPWAGVPIAVVAAAGMLWIVASGWAAVWRRYGARHEGRRRRQAERELRAQRDHGQQLLDVVGSMVITLDRHGRVTLANRKCLEVLRCTEGDIVGHDWFGDFVPEQGRDATRQAFHRLIAGDLEPAEDFENPVLTADGEERTIAWHNALMRDDDGRIIGTLSSGTDITDRLRAEEERRRLDAKIQQAQKLESLEVLTGGIAHDFNNLLMAILGNASLARAEVEHSPQALASLSDIEEAARRAADLCRQMLAYAGRGQLTVEPVNLSEIVTDMARMLRATIGKAVTLRLGCAADLPPVMADATQLRQVIMNLIINGAEAIGDQPGVIEVSTEAMDCDRDCLRGTHVDDGLKEGRYVVVRVADTGCGMDPDTLPRVFDPFFTTKFTGRGLGLAAVHGIVRRHHGAIRVDSRPGCGATFTTLLPVAEADAVAPPPADSAAAGWRGHGTVLLVADEESVRDLGGRMLARLGFSPVCVADGGQAVTAVEARPGAFVCVLLDLITPQDDGVAMLRELQRLQPVLPVIVSSGQPGDDVARRLAGHPVAGYVQKPYSLDALAACLRAVLERPPPA